jgi:hypothetical protein
MNMGDEKGLEHAMESMDDDDQNYLTIQELAAKTDAAVMAIAQGLAGYDLSNPSLVGGANVR